LMLVMFQIMSFLMYLWLLLWIYVMIIIEFQGPLVSNVGYSTGSATINVTYTAVTNIELRNPNGFDVYFLVYSIDKIVC
jgi:LEA14-like dessication related protein